MKLLGFLTIIWVMCFAEPSGFQKSIGGIEYNDPKVWNDQVIPGPDCYTIASGNFNDSGIWFNGLVPGVQNKCTISAGHVVTMTQNQTVREFDFGSAGKLVMGNFTLFINGN
jgi:hypothetical protein